MSGVSSGSGHQMMMQTGRASDVMMQGVESNNQVAVPGKKVNRRLMIERVCLENFKSYYGRKEIGPLHKCFTAVVGPNGSGKSNLIECLLFVFGKRAKRMRLNKLSELIHNSAQHKDCTHATVRVYF
jgi:structural maintenance of chromosome 4